MSLKFDHPFKDRALYNFDDNLEQPRHRWYPFKEGFSNELVAEAIQQQNGAKKKKLRVFDPFSGSGTTPLTSALLGHEAVGIEINPFFTFAANVKCVPGRWNTRDFRTCVNSLIREAEVYDVFSPLEGYSTFSEFNGNDKWLFNTGVLRACAATMALIPQVGNYGGVLRLAATRAAMMCCNAKKDGKCLRYYRDWKERAYDAKAFFEAFRAITEIVIKDIHSAPIPESGADVPREFQQRFPLRVFLRVHEQPVFLPRNPALLFVFARRPLPIIENRPRQPTEHQRVAVQAAEVHVR